MNPLKLSLPEKLTSHKWLNLFRVAWSGSPATGGSAKGEWIFASRRDEPKAWPIPADAVVIAAASADVLQPAFKKTGVLPEKSVS